MWQTKYLHLEISQYLNSRLLLMTRYLLHFRICENYPSKLNYTIIIYLYHSISQFWYDWSLLLVILIKYGLLHSSHFLPHVYGSLIINDHIHNFNLSLHLTVPFHRIFVTQFSLMTSIDFSHARNMVFWGLRFLHWLKYLPFDIFLENILEVLPQLCILHATIDG